MDLALSQLQRQAFVLAAALTGASRTCLFAASNGGPGLLIDTCANGDPHAAPDALPHSAQGQESAPLVRQVFHTRAPAHAPGLRCIPLLRSDHLLGALYQEVPEAAAAPAPAAALDALTAHSLALLAEMTEERETEAALHAAEARWRSLVQNAPASVYAVDRAGKLIFLNRTSTNVDPAAYVGMPAEQFILPAELPSFRRTVQHIFATGDTVRTESPQRMLDGSLAWFDHRCAPIVDEGEITGVIFVSNDITARKQAEEELRRARELAEQAYRAKQAFLTNMTHELRTPLSTLLGFAQLVDDLPCLDDDRRRNLRAILRSGEHLQSLVEDTLELALLEAGELAPQEERLELAVLLDELYERFSRRAAERSLGWQVTLEPQTPPAVYADSAKLRRILVHLLDNAFRYTEQGQISLRVSALPITPEEREQEELPASADCRLRFDAADTGSGLDAGQLAVVFEPFSLPAQAGHWGEGSSLGLPLSRRLTYLLGGGLTVETQPGGGSVFTLALPVRAAAQSVPGGGKEPAPRAAGAGEPLRPVSPPRLHAPPDGWLARLRRAAVEADIAGLYALADELAAADAANLAAADTIRGWAAEFDYPAIEAFSYMGTG